MAENTENGGRRRRWRMVAWAAAALIMPFGVWCPFYLLFRGEALLR